MPPSAVLGACQLCHYINMRAILCAAWAWASWPGRIREVGLGPPPHLMTAYGEPVEPIYPVHFRVRLAPCRPARLSLLCPSTIGQREHSSNNKTRPLWYYYCQPRCLVVNLSHDNSKEATTVMIVTNKMIDTSIPRVYCPDFLAVP